MKFKETARKFAIDGYAVIVILSAIYTVIWSYISLENYYALNTYVFDLGVVLERSWLILHTGWNFVSFLKEFLGSGIVVIVSPFFVLGGYKFLLVFQSFFIGFSAVPLYYIARHYLKNRVPALLIASAFLVYFPLAGANWYDFHYQALFMPLFLVGYAHYLRGNVKTSMLFLFLSGITRYPYVIFPLLLSLWITAESLLESYRSGNVSRKSIQFVAFSLILIVQLGLSFILLSGTHGLASDIHLQPSGGLTSDLFADFDAKILTVVLYLIPVLGLSLLSKKWSIFIIPAFVLIFLNTNPVYIYPITFMKQYAVGVAPFIFLGLIEGVSSITKNDGEAVEKSVLRNSKWRKQVRIASTVLVVTILLGTVFLPYGPYNNHTVIDYNLKKTLNPNMATFIEMEKLVSLIPADSGSVVIQNNIPQLLPRPLLDGNLLVPGINVYYNMTYRNSSGSWNQLQPDYVLGYPGGNYYGSEGKYPINISMAEMMNRLYATGNYGILGEASNMVLLEKGYAGPIKYYVPYSGSISGNSFSVKGDAYHYGNAVRTHPNIVNSLAWFGPYSTLAPGVYNLTFLLGTSDNSSSNNLSISVTSNYGSNMIGSLSVSGSQINSGPSVTSVSGTFVVNSLYTNVEFKGWINDWKGSLTFYGVKIRQESHVPLNLNYSFVSELIRPDSSMVTQRSLATILTSGNISTPVNSSASSGVSYLLGDIYKPDFFSNPSGPSMYDVMHQALNSGDYGVVAEDNGVIILERGYTGPVTHFNAMNLSFPASSFFSGSQSHYNQSGIVFSNSSSETVWYGPYTTLLPGDYNITFSMATSNTSSNNTIQIDFTAASGQTLIKAFRINGTYFSSANTTMKISFQVNLTDIENLVEFKGAYANWNGTLFMAGASVKQMSG